MQWNLQFPLFTIFTPQPPIGISGGIMFLGCPCVSACVHPGVCPISTISYKPVDRISPNFDWWCSFEGTDELIGFWRLRGQGQGHGEVRYLSELLLLAEAMDTHWRLGVEVLSSSFYLFCQRPRIFILNSECIWNRTNRWLPVLTLRVQDAYK